MIVLKHVTKTYRAKKGPPFAALKGIDLVLPSRGTVFLLGRSGSGKTTLLNLIGLLDAPTDGTVEIDGVIPEGKQLDDFRNRFSGFVFQDFALLEDETVAQNIALTLRLQSVKETEERVAQALEKVGLAGYERRYPFELSGGEKQRVAIARAIVKDSGVILADEPTGNLDSENGEEIFGILKDLSREKLVVVVSHDRGFAEKYADRIVELKDGTVVSDSAPLPPPEADEGEKEANADAEEGKEKEKGVKPHLPTRLALRMGWRNFGKKKLKSAVTFIVAALAMAALVLAQVCVSFNAEHAIAKTVKQNNIEHITIQQRTTFDRFNSEFGGGHPIRGDAYRSILGGIPFLESYWITEQVKFTSDMLVAESRERLEQNGFELYEGSADLTDDSLYFTDYFLSECYRDNWSAVADGESPSWYLREGEELVPLHSDVFAVQYDVQPLIGKTLVDMSADPACNSFNIAGIVRTGFEQYYHVIQTEAVHMFLVKSRDEYVEEYGDPSGAYYDEQLYQNQISALCHSNVYCTREYVLRHQSQIVYTSEDHDPHQLVISAGTKVKCDTMKFFNISRCALPRSTAFIMDGSDTTVDFYDIKLGAGEIILDERSYNSLFGGLSCEECLFGSTVLKRPAMLGETVHLFVERGGKTILDGDFKLAGVAMDSQYERSADKVFGTVYLGEEDMYALATVGLFPHSLLVRTDQTNELRLYSALRGLRYDNALSVAFDYSQTIYRIEPYQKLIGYAFLAIGVIMAIVTLLIVVSLISYNILAQKREIGILRALGARAADVSKIYFAQAAILSVVTFLAGMAIALSLVAVINAIFANASLAGLVLLGDTILTWVVLIFGSFGLMFAGTLLPLRKISRYRPADAIKQA